MIAYYKKDKELNKYRLLLLLNGNVCDGGSYVTRKDCTRVAKNLGIQEVISWEKRNDK